MTFWGTIAGGFVGTIVLTTGLRLAQQLGMTRILRPRAGGVLSALGLCASDRRRDTARTVLWSGEELSAERVADEVAALQRVAGEGMSGARPHASYEMRYLGQAFELAIPGPPAADPDELAERFAAAHEERYGYSDPGGVVELVHIRLAMVVPGPRPRPAAAAGGELRRDDREACFGGEWMRTQVLRGEPPAGARAVGPAIFELPESTLVLPPGWSAQVDEAGTIVADRQAGDREGTGD
jgi:N-methylhydantoinase A